MFSIFLRRLLKYWGIFVVLLVSGNGLIVYADDITTSVSWISDFGHWSVNRDQYFCYAISSPVISHPLKNINHGNNHFIIVLNPEKKPSYLVEIVMDYPLDKNKKVTVQVIGKHSNGRIFTMDFYNDNRAAFATGSEDNDVLVNMMKMGKELVLYARSKRGTDTRYVYSLDGLSKALEDISRCQ
ncbi:MAG: hypothetical protein C4617_04545 [Candidatus Liberibacter europaeus]|uniref:Invasion associated locus B family protein n=1 Tax=Candidatus Liberibacter europaeus TaxID=744859 RepID=A0A2T4VWY3_9HYPH|nr:hypothetical protein [Candidatus Liberibacter europaeus]PTL86278.1 MAG: hypothetical protein C4617_04545 [Candidatus Liberibacter europaeus]